MRCGRVIGLLAGLVALMAQVRDPLLAARQAYNDAKYEDAIELATTARSVPSAANSAAVILARAYLERYRQKWIVADLTAARDLLKIVDASRLSPRDTAELSIGLGEALYLEGESELLDDRYGAAAELFQTAMTQSSVLDPETRPVLFEWWANALDRQAQAAGDAARKIYERLLTGAEHELERDPQSAVASFWLAASARGVGDLDRATAAAVAAWIGAPRFGGAGGKLRDDVDKLMRLMILPERAMKSTPSGDPRPEHRRLEEQWEDTKKRWQ